MERSASLTALGYALLTSIVIPLIDLPADLLASNRAQFVALHGLLVVFTLALLYLFLSRNLQARERAELALRQARGQLELRVQEHTTGPAQANATLQAGIVKRVRVNKERERLLAQVAQARRVVAEMARALVREQNVLETIMEHTRTCLAYLNPQFNFVLVNSAYAQNSGHTREELLGHNHFEWFPHPENQAIFEQVRDTGLPVECRAKPFEYLGQPEWGITFWDWTLAPVKDSKGQVQGLVLSLLDVTQNKQMEQTLRQTRDELELRVRERTAVLERTNQILQVEIAERHRVEETLRESKARLRALIENLPIEAWAMDHSLGYIMQNAASITAIGDVIGKHAEDLNVPAQVRDRWMEQARQALEGQILRKEFMLEVEGDARIYENIVAPVTTERAVVGVIGVALDVTKCRRAEAALQRTRNKLEQRVVERTRELSTLLEISRQMTLTLELEPLMCLILDHLKTVVDYDAAVAYTSQDEGLTLLAQRGPISVERPSRSRPPLKAVPLAYEAMLRGEPVIIPEALGDSSLANAFREVTGERLGTTLSDFWSWMGVPLTAKDQVVGLLTLHANQPDYYSAGHVELALAFANQAGIAIGNARLYEQARELATLQERQRLARDLHDSVSQTLFSASLSAGVLPRLWERDPEAGRLCLEELQRLTRGALAEMRALLMELRPSALVETGLADLLSQLAKAITSRARVPVSLDLQDDCPLSPEIQITLYRIAQEALNNIAKHAGASHVTLSLRFLSADGGVKLCISDDGQGFDTQEISPRCLGLGIMRERAEAIGARLEIESQVGRGTHIAVAWTDETRK